MKYLWMILLTIVASSCQTYSDEEMSSFDAEIANYLKEKNKECERSDSGMYYTIIEPGAGNSIHFKDSVSFIYHGELLNGEVFDDQKEPVIFRVDELIGAWKEIMLKLKKGGKAFLVAPPQLGYGTHDLDAIPQNSILVFEMEVIDVI